MPSARAWRLIGSIILAFVLLLIGAWMAGLIPAESQYCERNPYTGHENCATYQMPIVWIRYVGRWLDSASAALTALATGVVAIFTIVLVRVSNLQASLTREAFIADKRAFVFASGIAPLWEHDATTGLFNWRIGPVWHNSGDTPTQGLQLYTDGFLSDSPMPPDFDFNQIDPMQPPGPGMMGPKMTSGAGQAPHMSKPPLTPQNIVDIQNGKAFFYLWGWARYGDILPGTPAHITRYCWRIFATGDPFQFSPADAGSVRFWNVYERRGNCADEECQLQGLG